MIKAPKWCKDAVPAKSGWKDARTGELLKSQGFSESQIAEWHEAAEGPSPQPVFLAGEVEEPEDD